MRSVTEQDLTKVSLVVRDARARGERARLCLDQAEVIELTLRGYHVQPTEPLNYRTYWVW